ncbi:MAG: GDSL-type esterase/lipase family protein [Anaerolineae bacterium]|jgi:hypothetical protein|nr:GDSL-type esterase/lipase family protein [Anaerolineae bacterium]
MFRKIAPIFALIGIGIGMGGGLLLLLMQVFPELAPGGQRFLFTDLDGDTFRHQPGLVRPPAQNRVLEDGVRFDDADGFRRPLWVASTYPIIAIGDSFTDGGQVPWTDILAQQLDQPVRNLGWSGFGPLEYAEVMDRYGRSDHQWVLVMFFEGNDLSNIQTSYARADQNGGVLPFDLTRVIGAPITDVRQLDQYSDIVIDPNDAYLYPLTQIRPDGSRYEMAYISDYLWWLNGDSAVYQESRNLEQLGIALQAIRADAGQACVVLVYAPTKERIYFPYADAAGNRRYVLENGREAILGAEGWITFTNTITVDYSTLQTRMGNLGRAVQTTAEAQGIRFIDLTPAFEAAAQNGDPAYYPYDSHWSARGHGIAALTIADALRERPCTN